MNSGYTIVYTKAEMDALPPTATKVWGIFAREHTFNDNTEQANAAAGLDFYRAGAPTIGEMAEVALRILAQAPNGFFLVAEEEGTDNFANFNNAPGAIEAGRRSDAAIGVFSRFIDSNPETLMLMASDSDAGGLQVTPVGTGVVPATSSNGAPMDGRDGTSSLPFLARPDKTTGAEHPFAISWAGTGDFAGGILLRGKGLNQDLITGVVDNVGVYRLMYRTLFGVEL
jgi:alkaline phosphatase